VICTCDLISDLPITAPYVVCKQEVF